MTKSPSRRARKQQEKLQRKLEREEIVLEFEFNAGPLQYQGPIISTNLTIADVHRRALGGVVARTPATDAAK